MFPVHMSLHIHVPCAPSARVSHVYMHSLRCMYAMHACPVCIVLAMPVFPVHVPHVHVFSMFTCTPVHVTAVGLGLS